MNDKEFIYNSESSVQTQQEPQFVSYEIIGSDSIILSQVTEEYDFTDTSYDPIEIASRLVETAKTFNLFGLSANQCGLKHRVCVIGNDDQYVAFFNPTILEFSEDTIVLPEMDINNVGLTLNIKRPKSIVVQYTTYEGEEKVMRLEGLTSRVLQQQIDRLNGITFNSNVSPIKLKRSQKSLSKKVKKYIRQNIVVKKGI